jgi:uncharacterized membrane protein
METVAPTDKTSRPSAAKSWLAVLVLGLAIFGLLHGASALLGERMWRWFYRWGDWNNTWLAFYEVVVLALIILLAAVIAYGLEWKRVEKRRLLIVGSWVLYLPAFVSSLFAVAGLSYLMEAAFVAGGVISMVPMLLAEHGILPPGSADWIVWGRVGAGAVDRPDGGAWHVFALLIVAMGLAITILGFIQVFRAHREKKLRTNGLYATVRHPQHLGIAIWTFGLAFAASTTAAYLTWFTVLFLYMLLALWEEQRLALQFGEAYDGYRQATPSMVPLLKVGLPLPESRGWRLASLVAYYAVGVAILCLVMQVIGVDANQYM